MIKANNCFAVTLGWGGNEKTVKLQDAWISEAFIGFTLVSFFITRIGYESEI